MAQPGSLIADHPTRNFLLWLDDKLRGMGRGLGERQRAILEHLTDEWQPLWQLAADPDDANEMNKARSAVRGLERRGLVRTCQMSDPDRLVDTRTITAIGFNGWTPVYGPTENSREWYGLWVRLRSTDQPLPLKSHRLPRVTPAGSTPDAS
jgi:hypothetical protein